MPQKFQTFRSSAAPSIQDNRDRLEAQKFYRSPRWVRLRAMKLRRSPICECPDRCGQLANECHHILDRKTFPEKVFDIENLEALTKRCHSRITKARQLAELQDL
jgi:5-methylcytosine-specific restriction endonuclease McrA